MIGTIARFLAAALALSGLALGFTAWLFQW